MAAASATIAAAPAPSAGGARILKGAGIFWFVVALLGQWAFLYYIAAFYGVSTATGNLERWNRLEALGRTPYVPGDTGGNLAYAAHALGAGVIALGGALQLIPFVRRRFSAFHRWNGRLFLAMVTGLSLSGFYLVWIRNTSPSFIEGLSTSLNGVLILTFAALALRFAMKRDIAEHQRWAMRLYLVSNAQWFLRVGVFGYFVVCNGLGLEVSFSDLFFKFWTWGCYLVPLAVLQLYFLARDRGGLIARVATASVIVALTLVMAAGVFAFGVFSQALINGAPMGLPD
ncbi:MAG: DUF2306 domain-containing protein [Hydrogenophilaceae bacterium]|nr:DUF2306 domain-containing protein [Hydrogenophilaceae bacterium]